MNGTHVAIGSGLTGMLAGVILYFFHWPIQSMNAETAADMAGLIVMILGGGGLGIFKAVQGSGSDVETTTTANTRTSTSGPVALAPVVQPPAAAPAQAPKV